MSSNSRIDALFAMFEPAVIAADMQLWGVEYLPQGKHSILRVFIDSENGVTVDDCVAVSHQVSGILDVEDPVSGEYHLEVSSPGADRPMFNAAQFVTYISEEFKLKLKMAVQGRRKFVGRLLSVKEEILTFAVDDIEMDITMAQIDRANLVPKF
ncbi:ribosome maturation factor RimP [Gammaproteobacteria bacterium 42_54_T18]|nr:ribosome maturation factor RimP [Gammaproteobacteria bacterium 42_54_T18]